jgi:hypothetical protein
MDLQESYRARPIRFLELGSCGGWRMKIYGLAYRGDVPRPGLVAAAKVVARRRLPRPARAEGRYGVGFMGVHEGRGSNLVFVDWWANENELFHHVFTSSTDAPERFEYVTPTGLAACVWDLAVIDFERQAWLETVLAAPTPDIDRYLERRFDGVV